MKKNRVIRLGEKVLTVVDRPAEDAAFEYVFKYRPEETVLNKPPISHQHKRGSEYYEDIH